MAEDHDLSLQRSQLLARRAKLSAAKGALLEKRLRGAGDESIETEPGLRTPPLQPVPRNGRLPLSFAQQRLWFLDQLAPGNPAYNLPFPMRLKTALNQPALAALEQALNEIVRRHEILRTTFATIDGQPAQAIVPSLSLTLLVADLSEVPDQERETKAIQLAMAEVLRPFDLARGPLLRATLLRLSEADHVLLLNMHHIVSDGWSTGVFVREIAALYEAFVTGRPSPLPELPIQYADFAYWQQQWLQGEALENLLSYWRQQLDGAPAFLALATDHPRPPIQSFRGAAQHFRLSSALSEALKALSRRESVTLFMTLLAAFKTLLYRYSGQADIPVGTFIANRNRAETEGLIGFFVNNLVLRTDLSGNPSFRELLGRVRKVCLEAYAHQDLPFEKLLEELQPQRDLSRTPLFQVMFVLQNAPAPEVELPGLTVSYPEAQSGRSEFDLTLWMAEGREGLIGKLDYSTDLFKADTISRMLLNFQTLLEGLAADPEQRLAHLPLLSETERRQLLVEWNQTRTAYPHDRCIHELFEAQAELTPEAVAVIGEDQRLSYRELNARANQLARHLRRLGVGPEARVGIYLERSPEMIVGLLGVLKAGGAYLPLDAASPPSRLAFMLADAEVKVLLTQQQLAAHLPEHQAQALCLDADWETVATESAQNLASGATPDNLAYVIYTSGSTGAPKGVMIQHRSLVNYTATAGAAFGLTRADRVLQFASLSFDTSAEEIFPCLTAGATLVLRDDEMLASSAAFLRQCEAWGISVLDLPTAYWHELTAGLEAEAVAVPHSLRLVIIGGEKALPARVASWRKQAPRDVRLVNTYGPTETTIVATMGELVNASKAPIGRPVGNVQTYVLDERLELAPVGAPGELHIGGAGLARGYLNRPEATAERFIPDPFSGEAGARLYRSGDVARYLPDGELGFLGRVDDQVKVRGYRIELGEIEAALRQHPAVHEAVVLAREDEPGDKRLVGYLVAGPEVVPTINELRGILKEKLPEYMVPSAYVLLERLPLTPSGKVDRRALPAPDQARPELEGTFVAPRDSLELQLVQIWEDVLGVCPIGITDDFFKLGGHSFLAVRLMAKIRKQFGQDLPLATLFQGATIEHLAHLLRQQPGPSLRSPLVGIQPAGAGRPFFCVHPVGGDVLCYLDLARHLGADQPFYGLQYPDLSEELGADTRVEGLAARYIEALRAVQPQGPYLLGGWSMGGLVAFEMAQQLRQQGQQVTLIALIDTWVEAPPQEFATEDWTALLNSFAQRSGLPSDHLAFLFDRLGQLASEEQLTQILEQARSGDIAPPELVTAQVDRYLSTFRNNVRAMQSYIPRAYPGQVTLFRPHDQFGVGASGQTNGWGELAGGGVETYTVPGNHYTMLREPNVNVLAERLKACLQKAQMAG